MTIPTLDLKKEYLALLKELLQAHIPNAEVWAYGSRVTGESHDGSDLDLVLRNPVDLTAPQDELFELKEALIESNLPILVDVLDWARLPESFYPEIEACYVVIQK